MSMSWVTPMAPDRGQHVSAPPRRRSYMPPETRPNPWWAGVRQGADHTKHAGHTDRERCKP